MWNRPVVRGVAVVLWLSFSALLFAQTSPQSAAPSGTGKQAALAPHDISGKWMGGNAGGGLHNVGKMPAMSPEAQAKFEANTAELKDVGGVITGDPTFRCEPPGVPHIYNIGAYMIEIAQLPDRVVIFYESLHTFRTIWTDGRESPKEFPIPLWLGFSVGHWEGNDLVVNTTGFNDRTWLNPAGYPHSDALHVLERFHRVDADHLKLDITLDDPKFYAGPWKMGIDFAGKPDWDFSEAFCVQSDQDNFKGEIIDPNGKPAPSK
jgi:hypothetical protein